MFAKGTAAVLWILLTLPAQWGEARPSAFVPTGSACAGYDPVSGEAYLIQQASASSPLTMWRFDDGLWVQLTQPAAQPPTRGATCPWPGHGLLVQGAGTWTWNGSAWSQVVTAHQPAALHGMDFDPLHGVVIALDVGLATWSFDGSDWQQLSGAWPTGGPSVQVARLAWEPVTQTMYAAAGSSVSSTLPNCPFYRWNGSGWTMLNAGARFGFAMTSLPGQGVFVSGGFTFPILWGTTGVWNGSQWTYLGLGSDDVPAPRASSLSWFDVARGRLVVASGLGTTASTGTPAFGCWSWDGAAWARPTFGRGPGFADAQAYDSWRCVLLQFGGPLAYGQEHDQLLGRGDDGVWDRLPGGPVARRRCACAFDSWRGRFVMIGGGRLEAGGGFQYLVDAHTTWEWDGVAWHPFPSPSPPWSQQGFPVGRLGAVMAFDRMRGRCVLFGGQFGYTDPLPDTPQNDTWEWDGATWTRAQPVHVPSALDAPSLWFDEAAGACVLWANGLWSWDGSDWTALATPPLPNGYAKVAFDAAREVVVATVGLPTTTTYELRAGAWQGVSTTTPMFSGAFDLGRGAFAAVDEAYWFDLGDAAAGTLAPFGTGCPGSSGAPVLHGEQPFRVASTRTVHLAQRPPGAVWFGLLGPDDDQWLGLPLPMDLAVLGAPQCLLHTGIDAAVPVNGADWTIVVPPAGQLLGARVRLQAFVLDAAVNALGATTSNGLRARIGS